MNLTKLTVTDPNKFLHVLVLELFDPKAISAEPT